MAQSFSVKPILAVSDTTAEAGDTITFICSSPGDSTISNFKLYKASSEVDSSKYVESPEGTFTLSNSTVGDTGTYTCTATADTGSESPKSADSLLDVVGKFLSEIYWIRYVFLSRFEIFQIQRVLLIRSLTSKTHF